jgi:hypothetical protein
MTHRESLESGRPNRQLHVKVPILSATGANEDSHLTPATKTDERISRYST